MIDWSNFNSSLIIEVTRPQGTFTCTGVAINPTTILTAAHCLEGTILKVRVSLESEYNPRGEFLTIEGFELHPEYDGQDSKYKQDIARIRLNKALPSTINFYPIIKKDGNFTGKLIRLGYGARGAKNIRTMVTPQFKNYRTLEGALELNDMFSYSGDSGGPIFLQQNGQMYLVALHSTLSHGPEGKYSLNPLLSKHKQWIESSFSFALVADEFKKAV